MGLCPESSLHKQHPLLPQHLCSSGVALRELTCDLGCAQQIWPCANALPAYRTARISSVDRVAASTKPGREPEQAQLVDATPACHCRVVSSTGYDSLTRGAHCTSSSFCLTACSSCCMQSNIHNVRLVMPSYALAGSASHAMLSYAYQVIASACK